MNRVQKQFSPRSKRVSPVVLIDGRPHWHDRIPPEVLETLSGHELATIDEVREAHADAAE